MQFLADQRKAYSYFLLAALVIHSSVLIVKFRSHSTSTSLSSAVNDAMKVTIMDEAMKAALVQHKKQIAQSEDSANKDKPKEAAFLSDKDRTFDRQTMARNVDIFKKAGKGNAAINQAAQKNPVVAQKPQEAQRKPLLKDLKLSDIGMAAAPQKPEPIRAPASVSTQGLDNGDPLSNGLSATNDYVEEVALGDFTHLNTVEYKFYGFYHRIRQKLEQFWGRSIQEKAHTLFRSGRKIASSQDLITSLQITMNEKGEIVNVKVLGASGIKELDDAAIESFNQAGPFPNPPKDLLVNGTATIEWGFVVKS